MLRAKAINVLHELSVYQPKAQMEFNRDGEYYNYDDMIKELRYTIDFVNISRLKNYLIMLEHSKELPIGSCCPWCGSLVTSLHARGCELNTLIRFIHDRKTDTEYTSKYDTYTVETWVNGQLRAVVETDVSTSISIHTNVRGIITKYILSNQPGDLCGSSIEIEVNKIS